MLSTAIIFIGLTTIVLFSAALIGMALSMRGQWDKLGKNDDSRTER